MKEGPIVREAPLRRPGFRRQIVTAAVILGALAVILVLAFAFFVPRQKRYLLRTYTWAEVDRADILETVQSSGTVGLGASRDITAPESGVVRRLDAEQGATTGMGAPLLLISSPELEGTLREMESELSRRRRSREQQVLLRAVELESEHSRLEALRLQLDEAQELLTRSERMRESGFTSGMDLANARKAVAAAQRALNDERLASRASAIRYEYTVGELDADVEALQGRIADIRDRIDTCSIRSTFVGRVIRVLVAEGDFVAQHALLLTIGDYTLPPAVSVSIPLNIQHLIHPGQLASIFMAGAMYRGVVEQKGTIAEEGAGGQSATVIVKVAFVERPEELVPGSLAIVDIAVGLHADALSLPRGPFLSTGRGLAVYRIDGDMARRVDVGFGITTGTRVEVVKGLEAGERVIVSSYQDFLEFPEIHIDPAGGVAHDTVQ